MGKLSAFLLLGHIESLAAFAQVLVKSPSLCFDGLLFRFGDWTLADIEILNKHLFITAKTMIYLVNLSEKDFLRKKNKWLPKIKVQLSHKLAIEPVPAVFRAPVTGPG